MAIALVTTVVLHLANADEKVSLMLAEAIRYFGNRDSHCVLLIDDGSGGQETGQEYSTPVVLLTPERLDWENRRICRNAVVTLGKESQGGGLEWLARLPVQDNVIFLADSRKSLADNLRLRRLPHSLYFVDEPFENNATRTMHQEPRRNSFTVYRREDYYSAMPKRIARFQDEAYFLREGTISRLPDILPEPQLDFGGHDFPAVAFEFHPYSMPDFETQTNHAGFEYEIVSIVTRYSTTITHIPHIT